MNIGKAIAKLRKAKKINQSDFSKKIGLSQTAVSQIESAIRIPHPKNMAAICEALEVPYFILIMMSTDEKDIPLVKRRLFDTPLYKDLHEFVVKYFTE